MTDLLLILLLGGILTLASVGWVVGLRRFLDGIGCDRTFDFDLILAAACVFPECLMTYDAMVAPGQRLGRFEAPLIAIAATFGSAAANMLVIGIIDAARLWRIGSAADGARRSLEMAAILLLIGLLTWSGSALARHHVPAAILLLADWGPLVALVACLYLIHEPQRRKPSNPDQDLLASPRVKPYQALILAGLSISGLIYGFPAFVDMLIPWFSDNQNSPVPASGPWLGLFAIGLGMLLAVPDWILAVAKSRPGSADSPTPRLLLSGALLMAIAAIAGLIRDRPWHGFASKLLNSCWSIVVVVSLVLILLLAKPDRVATRTGGLVVLGVVVVGDALALILLGP